MTLSIVKPEIIIPTERAVITRNNRGTLPDSPANKVGRDIRTATNIHDAMEISGLNWEVGTKELMTAEGVVVPNKAIYRKDNNEILGVVGSKYEPVQNEKAFDFFNDFITSGQATLESAGSVGGGKRLFIQAKINAEPTKVIGNDTIENYVMLAHHMMVQSA